MDTRIRFTPRSYEDFEPSFEWKREEGSDTLVISLPGLSSILNSQFFSAFVPNIRA